ncbi:MAG TPA: L-histidine N(alpha)-methyltransferase [Candidatus Saccharimonadales bacterium]|nr:L-histidine N(alpha)-methyltransferase [Candidatus Saccharimonadales bacterium]
MRFFRNSDVTKLYDVSDKAVRNWIVAAQEGKVNLELHRENDKYYIADTLHNASVIKSLVEQGRKYRNTRSHRKVQPKPEFYKLFDHKEISQIASHLETNHEYPQQYLYRGKGALHWAAYIDKLYTLGSDNYLAYVIELLDANRQYLLTTIARYKHVNVIDLGVGNGLAARELLKIIAITGKLRRYAAVDISPELLDIAEINLKEHFGTGLKIEKYLRDLTYDNYSDIVSRDSYGDDASQTLNIVLFLGGTLVNFKDPRMPLQNLHDSLGKNCIVMSTLKMDTLKSRRFFDFNPERPSKSILSPHFKNALELLGIDESLYETEQYFDASQKSRFIKLRLKFTLTLTLQTGRYIKSITFQKGDQLLIWRAWHFNEREIINTWADNGFTLLNCSRCQSEEYLLMTHKVETLGSMLVN